MDQYLAGLSLQYQFLVLIVCIPLIAVSADRFVDGASDIATYFGVSELVIGLTIVSWGTSAPELAVSVISALGGNGNIALGNVVGSNVFNVGLILGMCACFKTIPIDEIMVKRESYVLLIGVAFVTLSLYIFDGLNKYCGALLLLGLASYILFMIRHTRHEKRNFTKQKIHDLRVSIPKSTAIFILGLCGVLLSCKAMVVSATSIATSLGVSDWIIAVTVVAAGTSMPEFAASFMGVVKGKFNIAAGNIIGSEIMNFLGVLGISALLAGINVSPEAKFSTLLAFLTLLWLAFRMQKHLMLTRRDGIILIVIGLSRWSIDLLRG